MGAVLRFERKGEQLAQRTVPEGGAEIIIFPGVRFERLEAQAESPLPPDGNSAGDRRISRRRMTS